MTASIDTARRGVSDPLALTVDCGFVSNWYIVLFSVIENSNTLNRGLTRRLDANLVICHIWSTPRTQEETT